MEVELNWCISLVDKAYAQAGLSKSAQFLVFTFATITSMSIRVATTDSEIAACYPVMRELRPHVAENQFLTRVRSQERAGYRLAYVQESIGVVAVAGFRVGENLAWGRFLYVDDLVTLPVHRSKGYGAKLFYWLKEQATKEGCDANAPGFRNSKKRGTSIL